MDKPTKPENVPTYGLLHITRAYNRQEINFDEWLRLSRDWAERIIRQAAERQQRRIDVESSSSGTDEVG